MAFSRHILCRACPFPWNVAPIDNRISLLIGMEQREMKCFVQNLNALPHLGIETKSFDLECNYLNTCLHKICLSLKKQCPYNILSSIAIVKCISDRTFLCYCYQRRSVFAFFFSQSIRENSKVI